MAEGGAKLFQRSGLRDVPHRGDTGRGPALAGVFGKQVLLANGQTVTADEAYLRESVLNPQAKIVAGFPPIMPTFQGHVTEEQLLQLIESSNR